MYFSANTGSGFHIWRQRFPDGVPEQVTSGATEEQGIAPAPDGQSIVTSVGSSQSTVWVHDRRGERQIFSEGYGYLPSLSADGKKVYYLAREGSVQVVSGKLGVVDLESGQRDRLLPDFQMQHYSISADGKYVVFVRDDLAGHTPVWMAALDGRTVPRCLTSIDAVHAFFGAADEVIFSGREGGLTFAYRINKDGSGLRKALPGPVGLLYSVSPDGKWIAAWVGGSKPETINSVVVYAVEGGRSVILCGACASAGGPSYRGHMPPMVSWSADQRFLYLVVRKMNGTYAVPLSPGAGLPPFSASGLVHFPEDSISLPGARLVSSQWVFAGPSPSDYAFTRVATQRNIYRIPLP